MSFFLKKVISSLYRRDFEEAKHIEFQSLISKDFLKYRNMFSNQAILNNCQVFKIKKIRGSKILKSKAQWVVYKYK